MLKLAFD